MKTIFTLILSLFLINSSNVMGQDTKDNNTIVSDSTLKDRIRIKKHYLQLEDTVKIRELTIIQQEYKIDLDKILADSTEVFEKKRPKIERLMDKRNLNVSKILSKEEFALFLEAEPRLTPERTYISIDKSEKP